MPIHYKCCCGSITCPINCCDFWDCAAVSGFPPTSITISGTFQLWRDWDTGQSGMLEEYAWTITSSGAFVAIGDNCLLSDFGYAALNCTLNYTHTFNTWVPDVGDNSLTGGVLAIAEECAGCLEDPWRCRDDITYCITFEQKEIITGQNIYNVDGVLRYVCSSTCDTLCAAPRIVFDPDPLTQNCTITNHWLCCDATPDDDGAGTTTISGFEIIGAGGCPNASTWTHPRIHCSSIPGFTCPSTILNACAGFLNCEEITGEHTLTSGSETYNWYCSDFDADPDVIYECTKTITYTDRCVSTISVSVT